MHQQEIKCKEEQITQRQFSLGQFKDYPKIEEFRKEALETNKVLCQQLNLLNSTRIYLLLIHYAS